MGTRRIYLDNAATSWPKPEAVYQAVDHYQRELGAPAGRGIYDQAQLVDRKVQQTRLALARLIDAPDSTRVIFAYSGTDALMLALHGLLRPGDHVVTSVCDHNAVLRPLRYLQDHHALAVTHVGCDAQGRINADEVGAALRPTTRLVALVHASNVTGTLQPIEQVADRLLQHPARLLVDAAQTVGHIPLSVQQLGCDLLAAPGHKGLLGPLGSGFLYIAPGVEADLEPVRMGGTGTRSESDCVPDELPERFEAGNLNVPGILGMGAGIAYLQQHGLAQLAEREQRLTELLLDELADMTHVTCYGLHDGRQRLPVVSFNVAGHDPQEVAVLLDQAAGIQTRAGFHCAPRMHQALQTDSLGGTVRVSCGPFNQAEEIRALIQTLKQLARRAQPANNGR